MWQVPQNRGHDGSPVDFTDPQQFHWPRSGGVRTHAPLQVAEEPKDEQVPELLARSGGFMWFFLGFAHARKLGEENLGLFEPGVTGTSAELCESGLQLVHALKSKDCRIVFVSIFELAEIDPGKKKGE